MSVKDENGNAEAANIQTTINELVISDREMNNYIEYQKHNPNSGLDKGIVINKTSTGQAYIDVMD